MCIAGSVGATCAGYGRRCKCPFYVLLPATIADPDIDQEGESGIQYHAGGCGTADYGT